MATEQFTYTGNLNIKGQLQRNGIDVADTTYMKFAKIDKIVVHKAIPINTVRPGMTYYFSNGTLWIKDFDTTKIPTGSIWNVHQTNTGSSAYWDSGSAVYKHTLVHIPLNFDVNKFWTDENYIRSLCSVCPNGKLKTTSPDYEIWDRQIVITIPINIDKKKDIGIYGNQGATIYTGTPGRVYKAVNKNLKKDPVSRARYVVDKDSHNSIVIATKKHHRISKRRFFVFDDTTVQEVWSISNTPWQYTYIDSQTSKTRTCTSTGRYQYIQRGTSSDEDIIKGSEYDKKPHINYRKATNNLRFHSAIITPMKKRRRKLYPSVYSKKFCIGIKKSSTKYSYQFYPLE